VSSAADLVSPVLVGHHRHTAYLTGRIGRAMGLDAASLGRAVLAATLHDIGALSLGERLRALEFDAQLIEHAEPGFELLREFAPFSAIAPVVRCHHVEWACGRGTVHACEPVPDESHLVYLADRIAVLLDGNRNPSAQAARIVPLIVEGKDTRFRPEVVDAFLWAQREPEFWSSIATTGDSVGDGLGVADLGLPIFQQVDVDMDSLSRMLAHVVDFRSPYTAAHSTGVAASADALASVLGLPVKDIATARIAGHLHDLGKLAVPRELLEKPGRLSRGETAIIKAHAALTGRILGLIPELSQVADWASQHHERMDGTGYPDRLEGGDLALGARVIAVSDVFNALSEDRSYRPALGRSRVLRSIKHMAKVRHLDGRVAEALGDCAEMVTEAREAARARARQQRLRVVQAGSPL
jgi:HD-GYP domain-containing protein (c-di-GMP phosphodiesterase class II)